MATETLVHLYPELFTKNERILAESGSLSASSFQYDTGVCALRIKNELGQLILLPFQGQQIWSAEFGGRSLAMKSMFDEPRPTQEYLKNYGAFLLHCGATAMGVPSEADTHPLHGELPNAHYRQARLLSGQDDQGDYLALTGQYQHTVAFSHNYVAQPTVKLHAGSTLFDISLTVRNLKQSEMELMYLAHINFRPVDNARLVYSAPCTPEHVRLRTAIPAHVIPQPGYLAFIEELQEHPDKHNLLAPDLVFDPEMVFYLDYLSDERGFAHSLQIHPDGSADYVRHRPDQLDKGVRWICRTGEEDALGLVLPATAEPEGYQAEKAKGNVKIIPPLGQFTCDMRAGILDPALSRQIQAEINHILKA